MEKQPRPPDHTPNAYYTENLEREPDNLLVRAVPFCIAKDRALDIGAGTLIESKYLLEQGFKKVTALDADMEVARFAKEVDHSKLELVITSFKSFEFSESTYDLINAERSLFFYGTEGFSDFVSKIVASLKPGGIFTGHFFGDRDGWNKPNSGLAFQTKEEALKLLKDLDELEFVEEEKDITTAAGKPRHMHRFNFIVRKR